MTTFTAPGSAILQALTAVLPHVDKSGNLPALECVQLKSDGTDLTFAATERYTLAVWTVRNIETLPEFEVLLNGKALATAVKALDKRSPWTFDIDETVVRVTDWAAASVTVAIADAPFPKWESLIPPNHGDTGVERVGFNPVKLAKFAKAAERNQPLAMTWGERGAKGPTVITIGDNFVGLIMPQRLDA